MKNNIMNYVKQESKYWWTSLFIGIFAIVLGVCSICTPERTLATLTYLFVIVFFISGIIDVIFSLSNRKSYFGWGWVLAGGIIDILFAFVLLTLPQPILTVLLVYFVGFWILFRSIWTIGIAAELNNFINATWLLILGIISMIFSIFYIISPIFGGIVIVILVSIAFILYGIFRIYYSFQIRKINKEIKNI